MMKEIAQGDAARSPPVNPTADLGQDRTISPIAGRFGIGKAGKVITLAALATGCGVFLAATWKHGAAKPHAGAIEPARQVVNFEPAQVDQPSGKPGPTLANPGVNAPSLDPSLAATGGEPQVPAIQPSADPAAAAQTAAATEAQTRAAHVAAIRAAPIMAFRQSSAPLRLPTVIATAGEGMAGVKEGPPTELDQLRQGSAIGLARATRLPNRNFLITAGTSIPCTLQTAMDTATPGYVSCLIGSDVYSDNGAVILMEKGAKVLGEYRSGMKQGQRRLFVVWTRAVTPAGVAIGLASPASDALGRAGFDGSVYTHFWERFGGALLLSVVDDTASGLASRSDANGALPRVPSDAAAVALQNSINIPPSLTKAQGSQVAIFVAQDLDFSSVYALKAR